jgi:hypothetical protein
VGFIPVPPKGATDIDSSWHHVIHTILKPLGEVDISGTGYEWDCADGIQRICYPLLAAWIGNYLEIAMITKIVGGACPVCVKYRWDLRWAMAKDIATGNLDIRHTIRSTWRRINLINLKRFICNQLRISSGIIHCAMSIAFGNQMLFTNSIWEL